MPSTKTPILVVVLLILAREAQGVKRVTVDAAVRDIDDDVFLYAGGEYLLMTDKKEVETGLISDTGYKYSFPFTATAEMYDTADTFEYGADFYVDWRSKQPYSAGAEAFFDHSGPDAVADCYNELHFFKGCKMAKDEKWSEAVDVRDLGLPCSPDAAWKKSFAWGMVVLKGDQVWLWDCKGGVPVKKDFSSEYDITSWELIP